MVARSRSKMAERGSNDCHDYNDNGVAKPAQSLISCVIMDALRGSVFRCIYTVHRVSSTWKLDSGGGFVGVEGYHAHVEQPIHLDENGLGRECVSVGMQKFAYVYVSPQMSTQMASVRFACEVSC